MTDAQKNKMRRELKICGAATRISGYTEPCSFTPMRNGRCKKHGGKTPKGIAAPGLKDGALSHYIPPMMFEDVKRALNDPELLNLTKDLALVEGRIEELKKRVGSGASDKQWKALQQQWTALRKAMADKNEKGIREAGEAIQLIVSTGASQVEIWAEIREWQDHRMKLVGAESKRRTQMRAIIAIEDALWVINKLAWGCRIIILESEIKAEETKKRIIFKIAELFERYIGRDEPPPGLAEIK